MTLPPIYSRRGRQADPSKIDVYIYDVIPKKVRVQVVQILGDGLGRYYYGGNNCWSTGIYDQIYKQVCRELGVHNLPEIGYLNKDDAIYRWLELELNIDHWVDCVESALQWIDTYVRDRWTDLRPKPSPPDQVISEFNARLNEGAVGYCYSNGMIVRKDSEVIHSDVVVPTLQLLSAPRFAAANKEFREAHDAYRHGRLEECIVSCGKSLESVLKIIGQHRDWQTKETDTANKLIKAAVDAGFLPAYSQAALNHLQGLIESSTPTVRNKMGGHGAGATPRIIPPH
jgi:hypothetical protein